MGRRRGLALAGLAWLLAAPTQADEAERLALSRQIYERTHGDDTIDMQLFDATLPYFMNALDEAMNLTEGERAFMPEILRQEFRATLPLMREHGVQVYAQTFTETQLRQILEFYESDAGQAFLKHQADLNQDGINVMQAVDDRVVQEAAARLAERRTQQTP